MASPLVSICIPAYNCSRYITQTLDCLLGQTCTDLEIIVVNDGSTDDTAAVVENIRDNRLILIHTLNGGAAKARNIAYQRSRGAYVIFFDADDLIGPDFVGQQLQKMNNRADAVVLSAWGRFYNDNLRTFKLESLPGDELTFEEWINRYWYHCNPMTTPGRIMIPRKIVETAGLWNESLSLNDDLEFYTRIFLKAAELICNPDAVFYYRSGIAGLSSKKGPDAFRSLFNAVQLSTAMALDRYSDNYAVKQSCANLWQSLVYELYPYEAKLAENAEQMVTSLGGSSHPFPAGGYTKLLASLIGWKLTQKIKLHFTGNKQLPSADSLKKT
jgi:glycosyltransferase involved in cell wall biosynthesis